MKRVLVVFGTRPEAIKMCPLVIELLKAGDFETNVCVTGQHRQMLDQVLHAFGVEPDYDLSIMKDGQTLELVTTAVISNLSEIIAHTAPDVVLVHGDTTTSFAAAVAAFYAHIPIGHVEAGLRTWNLDSPFPEGYRTTLDQACQAFSEIEASGFKITAQRHSCIANMLPVRDGHHCQRILDSLDDGGAEL